MLIKDWEYWEDKLSMGHMALLPFNLKGIHNDAT